MATTSARQSAKPLLLYRVLHWLRLSLIGLLVGLSCLSLTAFVAVRWVEKQILTTDNWVAFVTPLPKQPVIYQALGSYVTTQLFSSVPVEQEVADALPPKAGFLAKPLTQQLQSLTQKTSEKVISSDAFQTVWVGANRIAIDRVLALGRSDSLPKGATVKVGHQQFQLDLSGTSGLLQQKLGSVAPALFNDQTTAKLADIRADLQTSRQNVRTTVRTIDRLQVILPLVALTSLLLALALSAWRRRILVYFSSGVIALSFLQLIGVKALRPEILNQIQNASFKPAVGYIYDQLVAGFNHIALVALVSGVVLLAVCLIVGPAAWAAKLRSFARTDRLQQTAPLRWWRSGRRWFAAYKYYAWLALVVIGLIYLAFFATVTTKIIVNTLLVLIALSAAAYIYGTPPGKTAAATATR